MGARLEQAEAGQLRADVNIGHGGLGGNGQASEEGGKNESAHGKLGGVGIPPSMPMMYVSEQQQMDMHV
jgi:hypothetical protein